MDSKIKPFVILSNSTSENFFLFFTGWRKSLELQCVDCNGLRSKKQKFTRVPGLKRYMENKAHVVYMSFHGYKGLWFDLNKEVLELTERFFKLYIGADNKIVRFYNQRFATEKFSFFLKKKTSLKIIYVWSLLRLMSQKKELSANGLILVKNTLNEFIINEFRNKYCPVLNVTWVTVPKAFYLSYYLWFLKEITSRGVGWKKERPKYKILKELCSGFIKPTVRDDIFVDHFKITKKDTVFLRLVKESKYLDRAQLKAKEDGYKIVENENIKVNLRGNLVRIVRDYLFDPLCLWIRLALGGQFFLYEYFVSFYIESFPLEVFFENYKADFYVSRQDWDDVAQTIMANRHGAKSVVFQWSDHSVYRSCYTQYIAHNIYFVWGEMFNEIKKNECNVDEIIEVGCIFKKEAADAMKNRGELISRLPNFDKSKKTVLFCDTSFDQLIGYSKEFYWDFFLIIAEYAKAHPEVNVIYKSKNYYDILLASLGDQENEFKMIMNGLMELKNFSYAEGSWGISELITLCDLCVSMSMNSAGTLALICGKDSLYYDTSGNLESRFAKDHFDTLVFCDKDKLYLKMEEVLNGSFSCKTIIDATQIQKMDKYGDDRAIERIITHLATRQ